MKYPLRWWRRTHELSADEQAAVDALRERARALPREAEPQRDLWLGIRNRIELSHAEPERRRVWRTRVSVPVWAANAAALLVLATSIGTGLWLRRPPSIPSRQSAPLCSSRWGRGSRTVAETSRTSA